MQEVCIKIDIHTMTQVHGKCVSLKLNALLLFLTQTLLQ